MEAIAVLAVGVSIIFGLGAAFGAGVCLARCRHRRDHER